MTPVRPPANPKVPMTLSLDVETKRKMLELAARRGAARGRPMSPSEWLRIVVAEEYERIA